MWVWQPMSQMLTISLHTQNTVISKFGTTIMLIYGRLGIIPPQSQRYQRPTVTTVIRLYIQGRVFGFTLTTPYKQR